jgi:hypothetical protein
MGDIAIFAHLFACGSLMLLAISKKVRAVRVTVRRLANR